MGVPRTGRSPRALVLAAALLASGCAHRGVPRVRDLITDEKKRALWDFVALPSEFGTAYVTAPGVPADKVAILRKAFEDTMRDPEFIAEAKKRNLDLSPKKGEELDAFYKQFGAPTPEITKETARLMGLSQ